MSSTRCQRSRDFPQVVSIVLGAIVPVSHGTRARHLSRSLSPCQRTVLRKRDFLQSLRDNDELAVSGATDIYITPYLNKAQITSGTLAYSYGRGKGSHFPPYWHARRIACGRTRGVPVPLR
jgi:hypothetical protein